MYVCQSKSPNSPPDFSFPRSRDRTVRGPFQSLCFAGLTALLAPPSSPHFRTLAATCGSCSYNAIPTASALPTPARPWGISTVPLPTAAGRDGRALPPMLATPPLSPVRAPAVLWPGIVCCSLSLTQMSACSPSLTPAWIAHAQPMIGAQHLLQLFLDKEETSPHPGSLTQPWASRGSGPQRLRGRQPPSPLILRLLPLLL